MIHAKCISLSPIQKTVHMGEQELSRKLGIPTTEQPSPVSVLDASYFEDETPSPVKMTSEAFKGKLHS